MLRLSRKAGQAVVIGDCRVTVLKVRAKWVRLLVEAPKDVFVTAKAVRERSLSSYNEALGSPFSVESDEHESRGLGVTFDDSPEHLKRLTFTRRQGESLVVGNCAIGVTHIEGNGVSLGFEAPRDIPIFRWELKAKSYKRALDTDTHSTLVDEILEEAGRLGPDDLRALVLGTIELHSKPVAPVSPERETELLLRVNEGIPERVSRRLQELGAKRDTETLTEEEYYELLRLSDEAEWWEADRVRHLGDLATLRKVPLPALMRDLGIPAPAYG
jgi:carbon storage regulator CsrA